MAWSLSIQLGISSGYVTLLILIAFKLRCQEVSTIFFFDSKMSLRL